MRLARGDPTSFGRDSLGAIGCLMSARTAAAGTSNTKHASARNDEENCGLNVREAKGTSRHAMLRKRVGRSEHHLHESGVFGELMIWIRTDWLRRQPRRSIPNRPGTVL